LFKKRQKKHLKGKYNFKDDDPIEKFDLKYLKHDKNQMGEYSLNNKIQFTMKPMKDIIKAKKEGNQIIPFVCSLKAADLEIPDHIE